MDEQPAFDGDMVKAAAQKQRERWLALFSRWWDAGHLTHQWKAKTHFYPNRIRVTNKGQVKILPADAAAGKGCIACAQANWPYRTVDFYVSLVTIQTLDDAELEEIVVHEIGHALVHEMHACATDAGVSDDHEERVVSDLAAYVMAIRDAAVAGAFAPPPPPPEELEVHRT